MESLEVIRLATQARTAIREAIASLAVARRRSVDAAGILAILNSPQLGGAVSALGAALLEFEKQSELLDIAAQDISTYSRGL